ncbi:MAG: hypothetical protein H6Q86_1435, partial [candidate division NC10 bacterium]|nr:hypothetical protein [candidate division NC10 bacterium]
MKRVVAAIGGLAVLFCVSALPPARADRPAGAPARYPSPVEL